MVGVVFLMKVSGECNVKVEKVLRSQPLTALVEKVVGRYPNDFDDFKHLQPVPSTFNVV